jgi:hypothetical protein
MLLEAAAKRLGVPSSYLVAEFGKVHEPATGKSFTYGELAIDAGKLEVPKEVKLKDRKDFKIIGTAVKIIDNKEMVTGKPLYGSRVLLLGVAYKRDIDDVRESPALDILHLLEARGAVVRYHDPHVARFVEDGRTYESVPLDVEALEGADAVVIVTDHAAVEGGAVGLPCHRGGQCHDLKRNGLLIRRGIRARQRLRVVDRAAGGECKGGARNQEISAVVHLHHPNSKTSGTTADRSSSVEDFTTSPAFATATMEEGKVLAVVNNDDGTWPKSQRTRTRSR